MEHGARGSRIFLLLGQSRRVEEALGGDLRLACFFTIYELIGA